MRPPTAGAASRPLALTVAYSDRTGKSFRCGAGREADSSALCAPVLAAVQGEGAAAATPSPSCCRPAHFYASPSLARARLPQHPARSGAPCGPCRRRGWWRRRGFPHLLPVKRRTEGACLLVRAHGHHSPCLASCIVVFSACLPHNGGPRLACFPALPAPLPAAAGCAAGPIRRHASGLVSGSQLPPVGSLAWGHGAQLSSRSHWQ